MNSGAYSKDNFRKRRGKNNILKSCYGRKGRLIMGLSKYQYKCLLITGPRSTELLLIQESCLNEPRQHA